MNMRATFLLAGIFSLQISVVDSFVPLSVQKNHHTSSGEGSFTAAKGLLVLFSSKTRLETESATAEQLQQNEKSSFLDAKSINASSDPANGEIDSTVAFSYASFAKTYPFANNIIIATTKTAAADLLAQTVIAHQPITEIDWQRSLLFCLFGASYLGAFQYFYQVQIFKKLFDVEKFTSQSWEEKFQDIPGLKALSAQTALDLAVLSFVYLPTFYVFKASVFSGSIDPSAWIDTGINNYQGNLAKDEFDLLRVWLPADLVCFSVPLYLRLPVRHIVSFVWTAYLSFARGGH